MTLSCKHQREGKKRPCCPPPGCLTHTLLIHVVFAGHRWQTWIFSWWLLSESFFFTKRSVLSACFKAVLLWDLCLLGRRSHTRKEDMQNSLDVLLMAAMHPPRATEKFLSSHPANSPALLAPSGQSSSNPVGTLGAVPPSMIPAQTTISTARFQQKCFVQPPPYIYHHQTRDYIPHFQYESFPILKATIMQPESAFFSSLLKHLQFPLGSQTRKAPEERASTPRTQTQVPTVEMAASMVLQPFPSHRSPAPGFNHHGRASPPAPLFPAPRVFLGHKTTSLAVSSQSWLLGLWKYCYLAACASMQHI